MREAEGESVKCVWGQYTLGENEQIYIVEKVSQ